MTTESRPLLPRETDAIQCDHIIPSLRFHFTKREREDILGVELKAACEALLDALAEPSAMDRLLKHTAQLRVSVKVTPYE